MGAVHFLLAGSTRRMVPERRTLTLGGDDFMEVLTLQAWQELKSVPEGNGE